MLTAIEFIAVEAVIVREDRLLRRLGIESGGEQCFESLNSLFVFLVLFFELLYDFGQLNNDVRLLRDLQIPWISLICCGVRHHARVTNLAILRNPNLKWGATILALVRPARKSAKFAVKMITPAGLSSQRSRLRSMQTEAVEWITRGQYVYGTRITISDFTLGEATFGSLQIKNSFPKNCDRIPPAQLTLNGPDRASSGNNSRRPLSSLSVSP